MSFESLELKNHVGYNHLRTRLVLWNEESEWTQFYRDNQLIILFEIEFLEGTP